MQIAQSGTPVNLSASGAVSLVPGTILGYHCNSTSGGTLVFKNGGTTAGTALNAAVAPGVGFTPFPAYCTSGCYVTISGTIDVTVFFAAG